MEYLGGPLSFDYGPVLAGAVCGLVLAAFLRIPAVAAMIALAIAGVLIWAILADPTGPTAVFEAGATRLGQLASTGFLTGLLLGKSAVSLVHGLASGALRKRR